jgi:hypothetical protein
MNRLLALLLILALSVGSARAQDLSDAPELSTIEKKYKIAVVTDAPRFPVQIRSGVIDGKAAAKTDADSYAPIFAAEWSLYPTELVKKTRLKKVVFCQDLSFAKQKRTAVPDFENDVLYLDVSRGRTDEQYVRKVIHHEFFHIIDLRDDGKIYEDDRWSKLNPPEFKYGPGGAKLQDDPTVTITGKDAPGFLNRYAAAGVEEDKAEVFAHMIVEPKQVAERAKKDKYMRAKVERMKELLAAFSPKVDDAFWETIERVERP